MLSGHPAGPLDKWSCDTEIGGHPLTVNFTSLTSSRVLQLDIRKLVLLLRLRPDRHKKWDRLADINADFAKAWCQAETKAERIAALTTWLERLRHVSAKIGDKCKDPWGPDMLRKQMNTVMEREEVSAAATAAFERFKAAALAGMSDSSSGSSSSSSSEEDDPFFNSLPPDSRKGPSVPPKQQRPPISKPPPKQKGRAAPGRPNKRKSRGKGKGNPPQVINLDSDSGDNQARKPPRKARKKKGKPRPKRRPDKEPEAGKGAMQAVLQHEGDQAVDPDLNDDAEEDRKLSSILWHQCLVSKSNSVLPHISSLPYPIGRGAHAMVIPTKYRHAELLSIEFGQRPLSEVWADYLCQKIVQNPFKARHPASFVSLLLTKEELVDLVKETEEDEEAPARAELKVTGGQHGFT